MDNPFHSPNVVSWRYLLASYIETKRSQVSSWAEFCQRFGKTPKTVKAIRDEFGIHESVGRNAQPSPNFHGPDNNFLGADI